MTDHPVSGAQHEQSHDRAHGHSRGHGDGGDHDEDHASFGPGSEERLNRSDQFYRSTDREIIDWLPLEAGNSALDAGCGAAGFAELLAEKVGPTGIIDAADTSTHLLEHNKTRLASDPIGSRINFHEASIDELPFSDSTYDLIWSSRAVHHLPDPLAGARELARVLKPGGTLAIREGGLPVRFMPDTTNLTGTGLNERLAEAGKKWMAGHVHFDDDQHHSPYHFDWTQMLRDAGLTDVVAKTFILEFMPPFTDDQKTHMLNGLTSSADSESRGQFLSSSDRSTLTRLIDPDDPEYIFNRPDLHYREGITIYTGKA